MFREFGETPKYRRSARLVGVCASCVRTLRLQRDDLAVFLDDDSAGMTKKRARRAVPLGI